MFYVFEGGDGVGKSTQSRLLREFLERTAKRRVLEVREPGGTELGEQLREILLSHESEDISSSVELFLFMAARAHLCRTIILPALESGLAVLADRFLWSSVVYQGFAGGLAPDDILRMGGLATADVKPTRTFLIDLEPEAAFQRLGTLDRVEERGVDFQRRVRQGYLALTKKYPEQFVVLDGKLTAEEIHRQVVRELTENSPEWEA